LEPLTEMVGIAATAVTPAIAAKAVETRTMFAIKKKRSTQLKKDGR
jgi:hypothetical protein